MLLQTGDMNVTANKWLKCYCRQVTSNIKATGSACNLSQSNGLRSRSGVQILVTLQYTVRKKINFSLSFSLCDNLPIMLTDSLQNFPSSIFFFLAETETFQSTEPLHPMTDNEKGCSVSDPQTMKKAVAWVTHRQWKRLRCEWPTDDEKGCGVSDPQTMKKAAVWMTHRQWKRLWCEWPTDNEKGCSVSDPQTMKKAAVWVTHRQWKRLWCEWPTLKSAASQLQRWERCAASCPWPEAGVAGSRGTACCCASCTHKILHSWRNPKVIGGCYRDFISICTDL